VRAEAAGRIIDFLAVSERLKRELRHSWLADGRRESVAEHTWHMALMAILAHPHLERPVDLARTLEMIVVHDLVEAVAGDVPFFEAGERKAGKAEAERRAMAEIRALLPEPTGGRVEALWREFEDARTGEARFARALDNLEVQAQHNLADLATWEPVERGLVYTKMDAPCAHDAFLRALCEAVKERAEAKMRAGGLDVTAVRAEAARG
jgi:putative hydrolases of HD superfamily